MGTGGPTSGSDLRAYEKSPPVASTQNGLFIDPPVVGRFVGYMRYAWGACPHFEKHWRSRICAFITEDTPASGPLPCPLLRRKNPHNAGRNGIRRDLRPRAQWDMATGAGHRGQVLTAHTCSTRPGAPSGGGVWRFAPSLRRSIPPACPPTPHPHHPNLTFPVPRCGHTASHKN